MAGARTARHLPLFQWLLLGQLALLARRHLRYVSPAERRRMFQLARRRGSLSPGERDELRRLTAKLAPRAFLGAAADQVSPVPLPRRLTGAPPKRP